MKKILTLLLMLILNGLEAPAQLQNWPPGGLQISPKKQTVRLPGSRFIPSSRRWNLVWADQLVPGWISEGKLEFAAKNYVGTQKIFADQIEKFRNHNSNFICLIYRLSSGINPSENRFCPDPKTNTGSEFIGVVSPKGYVAEYTEYFLPFIKGQNFSPAVVENMFQHFDVTDSLHRVWHQDPYWLMDVSDFNWQEYMASTCLFWIDDMTNDGCFFDVSVESNVSLYNPKTGNPSPLNFNWWEYPHKPSKYPQDMKDRSQFATWQNGIFLQYFQALYTYFHESNTIYLLIPNVDQMITTVYDPIWLQGNGLGQTIDGAMMENFGSCTGQDMYLSLERGFRHITSKDKILIAQFSAPTPEERLRRTAMYMMIKNENSYLNIINSGKVEWYPEYEIDLGNLKPLPDSFEEFREKGTEYKSIWKRGYDSGYVVCNTSDDTMYYNPYGEGWAYLKSTGGGDVREDGSVLPQSLEYIPFMGEILINPSQCLIVKKVDSLPNGIDNSINEDRFSISPNPVTNFANLNFVLSNAEGLQISISDLMGNKVRSLSREYFEAGIHKLSIDVSDLPAGMYYCEIKGFNLLKKCRMIKL